MQGLSAKVEFQREDGGEFIGGMGPQGDIFLTTRPITVSIKLASGMVENFFLETKKGISVNVKYVAHYKSTSSSKKDQLVFSHEVVYFIELETRE